MYLDSMDLRSLNGDGAPSPLGTMAPRVRLGTILNSLQPMIPVDIADPGDAGAIPVVSSGTCRLVTGGAGQTRTVAAPTLPGLRLGLFFQTDGGGDAVVTFAADFNGAGNNIVTFDTAGELVVFESVYIASGSLAWRLVSNPESTPLSG